MMKLRSAMRYRYFYLTTLIVFVVLFFLLLFYFNVEAQTAFHLFSNFFSYGLSAVKGTALILWLVGLYGLYILRTTGYFFPKAIFLRLRRLLPIFVFVELLAFTAMAFILTRYDAPLKKSVYFIDETTAKITYSHIAHNHFYKPTLGALASLIKKIEPSFIEPELGNGIFSFTAELFSSKIIAFGIYFVLLIFLLWFIAEIYFQMPEYKNIVSVLGYGIITFSLIKNFLDGGLINPENLIALAFFLFFILKEKFLSLTPVLLLAISYNFRPLENSSLIIATQSSIYGIFMLSGVLIEKINFRLIVRRVFLALIIALAVGIAVLAVRRSFQLPFGIRLAQYEEDMRRIIPLVSFYVNNGLEAPPRIIISKTEMSTKKFLEQNEIFFRSFYESIKIPRVNCNDTVFSHLPEYDVLALNASEKELKEAETMARSMSNEWLKIIIKRNEVSFVMKDCLPNKLNVSMHALKNLFTDKASIMVLQTKRNSF